MLTKYNISTGHIRLPYQLISDIEFWFCKHVSVIVSPEFLYAEISWKIPLKLFSYRICMPFTQKPLPTSAAFHH